MCWVPGVSFQKVGMPYVDGVVARRKRWKNRRTLGSSRCRSADDRDDRLFIGEFVRCKKFRALDMSECYDDEGWIKHPLLVICCLDRHVGCELADLVLLFLRPVQDRITLSTLPSMIKGTSQPCTLSSSNDASSHCSGLSLSFQPSGHQAHE